MSKFPERRRQSAVLPGASRSDSLSDQLSELRSALSTLAEQAGGLEQRMAASERSTRASEATATERRNHAELTRTLVQAHLGYRDVKNARTTMWTNVIIALTFFLAGILVDRLL